MNLLSVRIITSNITSLVQFYTHVTGLSALQHSPVFAEFKTSNGTLAIGGVETLQLFGSNDIARPAQNHSAIIEFRVENVDDEYERLKEYLQDRLVQVPTTMPWGNRSLLFRDPDGNLINFFTPLTPEAQSRFNG